MQMVTESSPSPGNRLATELSAVASACLFSLVLALGETGKMLSAVAAMLTAPSPLNELMIQVKMEGWRY